MYQNDVFLVV